LVESRASTPATVSNATTWYVRFFVDPPANWDQQLAARAKYHFDAFDLAKLYEEQAADELTGIELTLETAFDAGGSDDVRAHLLVMACSRARPRKNTWMVALYEGLASNPWYCSGGFRQVAAG
jgi:hypothetical protein